MKRILLGVICLMLMSSCSSLKIVDSNAATNAGAAAITALTLSDAQIAEVCHEYIAQSDAENTVLPASNAYVQRLNRIMARFHNIGDIDLNYKVYQSSTINAFASGDGSVRVYSGLMDVMDDDELFAVIGHEIGHLKNKDIRDAYRTAYLIVAARYGIAAVNTTAGNLSTGFLGDLGQQLASNAYSRKQEYEADEAAFQFCVTNNVDAFAMYRALNELVRLEGNSSTSSAVAQMFSTHPESSKRAARIKDMAEAAGYKLGTANTGSRGAKTGGTVKTGTSSSGNSTGAKKGTGVKVGGKK